jgi:isocitrate/isopropylmalate dehydrogenase
MTKTLLLLAGDGIGPEVTAQSNEWLSASSKAAGSI